MRKQKLTKEEKLKKKREAAEKRAAEIEQMRQLEEEARLAHLEEQRLLREVELRRQHEERVERRRQLLIVRSLIEQFVQERDRLVSEKFMFDQWTKYVNPDGFPDLLCQRDVNTYLSQLHDRHLLDTEYTSVIAETGHLLRLINELFVFINENRYETRSLRDEMSAIYEKSKSMLSEQIDSATYMVMTDLRPYTDIETNCVQFCHVDKHVHIAIWANLSRNAKHKSYSFDPIGVSFELPKHLMGENIALRILMTKYDFRSNVCRTYNLPEIVNVPEQNDLIALMLAADEKRERKLEEEREMAEQLAAQCEAEELERIAAEQEAEKVKNPRLVTKKPNAKSVNDKKEDKNDKAKSRSRSKEKSKSKRPRSTSGSRKRQPATVELNENKPSDNSNISHGIVKDEPFAVLLESGEVNLRKYSVIGGLFEFTLLVLPPQPRVHGDWTLHELGRQQLETRDFSVNYVPPVIFETLSTQRKSPEEIEREQKLQEAEKQKLILANFRLSSDYLWFEPPIFVRWNHEGQFWSTDGFYEINFNEELNLLQSRVDSLGQFAIAVNRFTNLPFQTWSYRPTGVNQAEFDLTASVASIRIAIEDDRVYLRECTSCPNNCMQQYYDIAFTPKQFIHTLRSKGLDIFPDADSHIYVEGTSLKHVGCENHLYWCISSVGASYTFSSSKWNMLAGADNIVLQFSEMIDDVQGDAAMLLVRPDKTTIIECRENDGTFSEKEAEGIPFFADLYNLIHEMGSDKACARMQCTSRSFIHTLHYMLSSLRLLSFS